MLLDCAIVGGGPAGLNVALVLGRAKKNIILFDDNKPRNAVTHESHGFITRDGISPAEFKRLGREDLNKYSSYVSIQETFVTEVKKEENVFTIRTSDGNQFESRKVILATGLKDKLPEVNGIHDFYGKSLFNCPFCDGWELKDQPLVLIAESEHAFHMARMIYNWSKDLLVCTNAKNPLTEEQKQQLVEKNITIIDEKIEALHGEKGFLEKVTFTNGAELSRVGGFIAPNLQQSSSIAEDLGCKMTSVGGVETDPFGRSTVEGVFVCGDSSIIAPAQLIIAAAEGSKAAIGVVQDLIQEDF